MSVVYSGIRTFLKSDTTNIAQLTPSIKFPVVGLPYDDMTTYRSGARMGPSQIREASLMLTDGEHPDYEVDPTSLIRDCGDLDKNVKNITDQLIESELYKGTNIPVILGGDHSYTLHALRAAHAAYGPVGIIHFDAHVDTWDGPHNHGTFLREAIDDGLVKEGAVHQIGIRSPVPVEVKNWNKEKKIDGNTAQSILLDPYHNLIKILENIKRNDQHGLIPYYLTFDIDVYDPSAAPGTGTPEPGGLMFTHIKHAFQKFKQKQLSFIGFDLMEVSPSYDTSDITSILAANTIYEFMCSQM